MSYRVVKKLSKTSVVHYPLMLEAETDPFSGSENSHSGFIITFGYEEIDKFKDVVREIIEKGYESLGGTRASLDSVFADTNSRYRIFSLSPNEKEQESFCAVAIHQINNGCPRLRYIAGRGEFRSKGVYALVEYEMQKDGYCYIAEVSGAIEHIYAKSNAYIVPNIFAAKLLKLSNANLKPIENDLFHYKRFFTNGDVLVKALYGFKNKANYDKVSKNIENNAKTFVEFDNYEEFRKAANKAIASGVNYQNESFLLEADSYSAYDILDDAMEYIVRIQELHQLEGINEFPEKVFEQAEFMLYVIKNLGDPKQYQEALATYNRWQAEVTPFVLLIPSF